MRLRDEERTARHEMIEAKKATAAADLAAMVSTLGLEEALASLTCNELRSFCGRLYLGASRGHRQDMMDALSNFLKTAESSTARAASERAPKRSRSTPAAEATTKESSKSRAKGKATPKAVFRSKRKGADSDEAPLRRLRQKQPEPVTLEPGQDMALATADLNEMTVRDLRWKARELLINQNGTKEELIERIVQAARVRATIGVAGAGAASALTAAVAAATAAHGVDAWPQALDKQVRALNSACAEWGGHPIGGDLEGRSVLERSIGRLEVLSGGLNGRKNIVIRDGS